MAPTLAALPLHYGYMSLPLGGYLQIPAGAYSAGSYTVELWAYITTNTNMSRLFEMSDSPSNNVISISSSYVDGSAAQTDCGPGSCTTDAYAQLTATGIWTHFAASLDHVGRVSTLYINGEAVKTGSHSSFIDSGSRANIFVGKSTTSGQGPWVGRVDELRFWSVVRTPAQINASMSTSLVGSETGLQFYYRFDECFGNSTADLKGTAGAATLFANATLVCACERGYYYNSSACAACPVGRFTNSSGATQCNLCEAGKIQSSPGFSMCDNCGFGNFANRTGMSQCDQCDAGYFSGSGAFTACLPCAYGSYAQTSAAQCITCGNGTYAPQPAATVCLNCSVFTGNATYCPSAPTPAPTASPTATPTPAPTATPTRAPTAGPTPAPTALSCPPGSYSNTTACIVCDPGTFQGNTGPATVCQACAPGRFSAVSNYSGDTDTNTGDFDCPACAAGRFASSAGSTTCELCPKGFFNADTHGASCTPCPYGLYARADGATECVSEGNVPFATERLNTTEITLLAAPGSAITITPLTVASCPIPAGVRVVEMFRASGTFSGIVDVQLRSNSTRRFWPRGNDTVPGRDLFTCVNGTWLRSYTYECGDNVTAPLESTEDLWGKGTICHFTEFAILDGMPATEYCDPVLEGDQPMPRLCLKCADPTKFDCGCTTKDTDSLALERPEIQVAIAGIVLLFLARAALLYLRTSLDRNEYQRLESDTNPLVGVQDRGPPWWAMAALEFGSLGVLFYLVPVMANVETDWALHNLTRTEITHMFYAAVLLGWGAELAHNMWYWFIYTPKKDFCCESCPRIASSIIMLVLNAGAAASFFVSQSALYAPAVEVQTAGSVINSQTTGREVWDNISGVNQFAIGVLLFELSVHGLTALFEFVTNAGACSGSTKTGVMRFVFFVRFVSLTLAAVAWGMLRARHPCD